MPPQDDIAYDILDGETVRQLRAAFQTSLAQKAAKAVPANSADPAALALSLQHLLLSALHKGVEIKPAELSAIAEAGIAEADRRRVAFDAALHVGMPDVTKFPSPGLSDAQKKDIAAAATHRAEDETVQAVFGDSDRLYLKFRGAAQGCTEKEIADWLTRAGYRVTDYAGGYATDASGKQQFKIGKLLKDNADLKEKFRVDTSRTSVALMAVISRNPDDIANMATGRAWSSCMGSGGVNFYPYVPEEIRKGSLVAYLVSEKDPDILNPLARIIIKPYVEQGIKSWFTYAARYLSGHATQRPEIFVPNKTYGLPNEAFPAAVTRFVEEKLNAGKEGEFRMPETLYKDGLPPEQVREGGRNLPRNGLSLRP